MLSISAFLARSQTARTVGTLGAAALTFGFAAPAIAQLPELPPSEPSESDAPAPAPAPADVRFACESAGGQYTVMYYPESQPGERYAWATPTQLGGGWTPQRRCQEIARRLESYRPDGLLELGTSLENGYDVVCVTTQANPSCRIVLTVPPGQDPEITRDLVFENIVLADRGTSTDAVTALTGNRPDVAAVEDLLGIDLPDGMPGGGGSRSSVRADWIDLRPFLDPADGGTGAQLQDTSPAPSGRPRLNPEGFR